jgi:Putative amidoligase enzyme
MVTPLFVAFPSSIWRSHVEATWSHLLQHYEVTSNDECGTHVHISLEGGYSLDELKLVAQAALHFEPSFEALVPEARRHHSESQSSWIDSREFAIRGQSRADSILMISRATSFHTLVRLMQPHDVRGYIWNFRSIFKYYTLEFRKPPASKTANEALAWAELAMSFIQTSIKYGSPERLSRVPPTVGGLRWFLRQHHVAIMNEPNRLNWIWEGLDPNSFVEGRPLGHVETPTQLARIERTIASDERRILQLIQSTREPYW